MGTATADTGSTVTDQPPASGWPAAGTVTAYAAAIVAFGYALMSLYWALGGHALVSTVGGYAEQFAQRGGALPVAIALAATLAKVVGGLLPLALARRGLGPLVPAVGDLAGSGHRRLLAPDGEENLAERGRFTQLAP
jgi:hypothetical protein